MLQAHFYERVKGTQKQTAVAKGGARAKRGACYEWSPFPHLLLALSISLPLQAALYVLLEKRIQGQRSRLIHFADTRWHILHNNVLGRQKQG